MWKHLFKFFRRISLKTIYTAGKLTVLTLMTPLIQELRRLHDALMKKSEEFVDVIKMGRTQLQDAVPMRLGQTFHG